MPDDPRVLELLIQIRDELRRLRSRVEPPRVETDASRALNAAIDTMRALRAEISGLLVDPSWW